MATEQVIPSEPESDFNVVGGQDAKIIVICDSPSTVVFERGEALSKPAMRLFMERAEANGFTESDFVFITPCPPISKQDLTSSKRVGLHLAVYRDAFIEELKLFQSAEVVVYLGPVAGRQLFGRSIKITKTRGKFDRSNELSLPAFGTFTPNHVFARPEIKEIFETDIVLLGRFRDCNWDPDKIVRADEVANFRWCKDLSFLVDNPPAVIAVDTETDGLQWMEGNVPIVVSLCWGEGEAVVVPLDREYYPDVTEAEVASLKEQLKAILQNPETKTIGHNFKFDWHMFKAIGIEVTNWWVDTVQLAHAADENMRQKNLADCVKRWVPDIGGYSDKFEDETDYAKMRQVPHDDMLNYAAGDALATWMLGKKLVALVQKDSRQWNAYFQVQMPALRTFAKMEEFGIRIDTEALSDLQEVVRDTEEELYRKLIKATPPAVLRKHRDSGLSFTRDKFVQDILFSRDGFNFTPKVYTKTTKNLSPSERIPSVSAKDHLPYFMEHDFVVDLIEYKKLQKMRSTYVGRAPGLVWAEVKRLANGKLPTKLRTLMQEGGYSWDAERSMLLRDGSPVRSRVDATITIKRDPIPIRYKIAISDNQVIAFESPDHVFLGTWREPTGIWSYLKNGDTIHPQFLLDRTVTGRSSSLNPNAQNFPKRGKLAKAFRKIFIPRPGYKFIQIDLSQAELRVAAWMARETNMIRIYRDMGDIHANTAAATLGIAVDKFTQMKNSTKLVSPELRGVGGFDGTTFGEYFDFKRFQAKAINFGFLYGMGWRGFKIYAKTDYGLDLTEDEAQLFRRTFFRLYPKLEVWHESMRDFVRQYGYVRSLHGALRRLPSIASDDDGIQSSIERMAINSPVQRFASDLGLIGMSEFGEVCEWDIVRPLAFIHDAVVIEVREDLVDEAVTYGTYCMQNQPLAEWFDLDSPVAILADPEVGDNLSDMEASPIKIGSEYMEPPDWRKNE